MKNNRVGISGILKRILWSKEGKNAGWIIIAKVVQMVLAFIVSIIMARYLGPSNFGLINYATAFVTFFTSLCTLGINSVIVKDFIENPNEQGTAIGSTIGLRFVSSVLSSLLVVLLVSVLDKGEKETIIVAALCSLSLVFEIFDTISYWFQSRYESKVSSICLLIAYFLASCYKILLFVWGRGVRWFAFSTSLEFIILSLLYLVAYKKYKGPKLKFSFAKGKKLLSESYHYILSGMMVAIYGQTDRLMLKHMLDEASVGYYSLASSVNTMWVFVLAAIISSLTPTIIQLYNSGKREEFNRKNRQLYAIVIYLSIFVALFLILFGKVAVILVYGDAYAPAAEPLKVVAWYTIFSYLGVARNPWIVCEKKQKYLKYMYLSAVFANIILNVVFIPIWGATGAAVASLITQICTSMIFPALIPDMRENTKLMLDAFLLRGIK